MLFRLFTIWVSLAYLSHGNIYAQDSLQFRDILLLRTSKNGFTNAKKPSNLKKYRPIESAEIRLRSDQFEQNRTLYSLRLKTTARGLNKARNNYLELLNNAPDIDLDKIKSEEITNVAKDWVELLLIKEELQILMKEESILSDLEKITETRLKAQKGNLSEYLNTFANRTKIILEKNELQIKQDRLTKSLGIKPAQLKYIKRLAQPSILATKVVTMAPKSLNDKYTYEDRLLNAELEIESKERNQLVDFLQLRYQGPHDDPWQERLSLGAAVNLPFFNSNLDKMNELFIDKDKLSMKRQYENLKNAIELEEAKDQFWEAFNLFKSVESFSKERAQSLQLIESSIKKLTTDDLKLLLEIKIQMLDLQKDLLDAKEGVYQNYLEILKDQDVLDDGNLTIF